MKTLVRTGVAAGLVLAATCVASPASADVRWETDMRAARRTSLEANRPILVEFWAKWCGPCGAMDREVFSQERVASAMQKVLPVRVDIDREEVLSRAYAVEATPTFILTDGYGNELFRYRGALAAESLLELLSEIPPDLTRIHGHAAALKKNKNDFDALRGLGQALRENSFFLASNGMLRRAIQTEAGRERTDARAEILLALAANYEALRLTPEAETILKQFRQEFPDRPVRR